MSNKFKKAGRGPFKIIEKCSEVKYEIQIESEPKVIQNVHINKLLQIPERKKNLRGNDNHCNERTLFK